MCLVKDILFKNTQSFWFAVAVSKIVPECAITSCAESLMLRVLQIVVRVVPNTVPGVQTRVEE